MKHPTLDELWEADPPPRGLFGDHAIAALPPAARRYLRHAIDEDAPLATAVRLRMHGEIKLKGWVPFEAEQVLRLTGLDDLVLRPIGEQGQSLSAGQLQRLGLVGSVEDPYAAGLGSQGAVVVPGAVA